MPQPGCLVSGRVWVERTVLGRILIFILCSAWTIPNLWNFIIGIYPRPTGVRMAQRGESRITKLGWIRCLLRPRVLGNLVSHCIHIWVSTRRSRLMIPKKLSFILGMGWSEGGLNLMNKFTIGLRVVLYGFPWSISREWDLACTQLAPNSVKWISWFLGCCQVKNYLTTFKLFHHLLRYKNPLAILYTSWCLR